MSDGPLNWIGNKITGEIIGDTETENKLIELVARAGTFSIYVANIRRIADDPEFLAEIEKDLDGLVNEAVDVLRKAEAEWDASRDDDFEDTA